MLNNYKNLIILFLSLFIAGAVYVMKLRVETAKSQLSECRVKIEQQNYNIELMKNDLNERIARQAVAEKNALKKSERYEEIVDKIMGKRIPNGDVINWLILQGQDLK